VILILGMAVLRLRILDNVLIPVGYSMPLILFVWLASRRFLWITSTCYVVISAIRFYRVLPADPHFPARWESFALQVLDITIIAVAVHILIALRRRVESSGAQLAATVASLTAKEEEVARQNEELQSQTEELERQSEELRIANEDLAAREKTLEHLLALSRSLSNELTRSQVLDHVCEALGFLMGSRAVASAIVERTDGHVRVSCHHGFGPDGLAADRFSLEESFATVVLNRSQTAYLDDLALRPDLRVPQPRTGEPMRSVLATPLRVHGRPVGTVEVYSRQTGMWSEEHVALLESLAAQTSISLEAATLFEDVDRERRRFEAVFRTLPIGIAVSNADHSEVRLNPAAGLLFGVPTDAPQDIAPTTGRAGGWQLFRAGRQLAPDEFPLYRAALLGQETPGAEFEVLLPGGKRLTVLGSASPIRDKDGKTLGAVAAFTDITERKALERELDQRRREAEESAVRKTRFLAAVSHDIRTPANAINLMAELIRRAAANPAMAPEVPSLAGELQSSATSLVTLVSDVLDLTRFDTGRIELNESDFALADAVAEEVRQQTPVAQSRGITLRYEPPAVSILARTDRVKLGRVLGNLIGNAIKFTPAGEVTVSLMVGSDRQAHIHVRDTGVGIPPEHLPRIFDEFFQLRNPERDPTKGTGLGLTICKRLVDAMGGDLLVESEPNRGSVFTLVLPAAAVTTQQASGVAASPATRPVPEPLHGLRVLVVEDEHVTRAAARRLLESEGATVTEAAGVRDALRLLHDGPVNVLLLDLMLPDGSGHDVLAAVRDRRPAGLKTILVLTGDVSDERAAEMRDLGADALIPKPVNLESVLAAIRKARQ
jgi:signal transduction histidine kinase/CheY-like chemotaxis protein